MSGLSLLRVEFVVLFTESLLFGAFCILYAISMWILIYRRRRSRRSALSLWMAAIVTTMFLSAGVYYALEVKNLMMAFVDHSDMPGGPLAYIQDQGHVPFLRANPYIFALISFVGDCFMTYRIYVVYDRKLSSLILPVALLLGQVFAGAWSGHAIPTISAKYPDGLFVSAAYPKMITYFVLTLLTNIVTTLLLLGRLWWSERRVKDYRSRSPSSSVQWRIMKAIVQCEAAYSAGVVFNLVVYAARSNLVLLAINILPCLVGISFTMIITRIGLSEVLDSQSGSHSGSTDSGDSTAIQNRARTSTPIAINVFISQADDVDESGTNITSTKSGTGRLPSTEPQFPLASTYPGY